MHIVDGWLVEALDGHYGAKSSDRGGYTPKWLVLHGTAGGQSAQAIDDWFTSGLVNGQPVQASSHIIIDQAGVVIQGVSFDRAAWANCCTSPGHAPYLADGSLHNLDTISIEHVKTRTDNGDILTPIQAQKSFEAVACICDTYGIPKRAGDATGGIISHADIDPINRSRCPGPYPWQELLTFLHSGGNTMSIPKGWSDDGTVLTAPNGHKVVRGFREYVLSHNWDPTNEPLEAEQGVSPVEDYFPSTEGTRQMFRYCELGWTQARGVYVVGLGNEVLGYRADLKAARAKIATLQSAQPINDMQTIAKIANQYSQP